MNYTDEYLIKQVDIILKQLGTQMEKTLELDIYEKMTDEVDPYDKELFNHTLKDGYEYDSLMRINIIGFFAQGKTTLTRRLLGEHLDQIAGTDSIEVFVRKCKIQENMWTRCDKTDLYEECSWRLVDITNREHICPQDFEKENCKDETDSAVEVFEMEISIHDTNDMQSSTLKGSNTALVNKLPYNQHTHITKEKDDQLQRLFSNHLRDSDSTDKEVLLANIWDFGGQFIYYATHQIFHSKEAIYLLVFDLTKDLDAIIIDCDFPDRQEKMRNSLLFWVNSIHAYVGDDDNTENIKPIIILVGTHKDKYKGSFESKLREVFDLFAGTRFRKHIYEKPFAVSSLDPADKGIQDLKREIYVLGINNAKQYKIPAKWLPLEIAMLRERDEKNKKILEMKDIIYLDSLNTYPISDKTELKKFLNYHHAKGTIVFFDEEDLDKYIVLKPQFIINAFRCIISAKWFSRWNYTLHQNAYSLTQNAILEQEFLQEVWTEDGFIKFKDILLMFLKKHGILAELRQIDEETGNVKLLSKYMIPSLLKSELDLHQTNNFLQHKKYTVVLLGLELEGLITTTIFEKCTAALLGKWPPIKYNDQILVSKHEGFYRLDLQHAGLIQKSGENIELMVINLCPEDHPEKTVCDRFRRYIEMVVSCEKSGKQTNVKPYNHYFKCNDSQHMGHGSHNIHYLNDIRNKTKICCPDNESHPIKVQEAIAEWFKGEGMTNYETSILRKLSRDKLVSKVAQEYGTNWKIFGSAIGLSSEDLQIIRYQCYEPKDVKIFIFEMFRVWKEKYPDDSVYMQEKENQTEDITNVDWDKVRNCLDVQ